MSDSSVDKLCEPQKETDQRPLRDVTCNSPDPGVNRVPPVVFVDLDGSLIATDLLVESILKLLKTQPFAAAGAIWSRRRGPTERKQAIAEHIVPYPRRLPYREELLEQLRELCSAGASLVLATAMTAKVANRVSAHFRIFDAVLARLHFLRNLAINLA